VNVSWGEHQRRHDQSSPVTRILDVAVVGAKKNPDVRKNVHQESREAVSRGNALGWLRQPPLRHVLGFEEVSLAELVRGSIDEQDRSVLLVVAL
jgi:hypothetical protein